MLMFVLMGLATSQGIRSKSETAEGMDGREAQGPEEGRRTFETSATKESEKVYEIERRRLSDTTKSGVTKISMQKVGPEIGIRNLQVAIGNSGRNENFDQPKRKEIEWLYVRVYRT